MSFGNVAPGPARRPHADAPCPCGGGRYGACCGPLLDGRAAADPEEVMRSRFTAFALGDAAHLRRTWHPSTRPSDLVLDPAVAWERLEVVHADGDTVTFRAHWRDAGTGERGVLAEVSRFVLRGSRWVYLDGAVA